MSQPSHGTRVELHHEQGYRFRVRFPGGMPELITDEPPPLGGGAGPNPTALLATALANCLASSLLFCLRKQRIETSAFETTVEVDTARNPEGRMRITGVRIDLAPEVSAADRERMGRCLELFESFCVVTESVRHGIPVSVGVEPRVRG